MSAGQYLLEAKKQYAAETNLRERLLQFYRHAKADTVMC